MMQALTGYIVNMSIYPRRPSMMKTSFDPQSLLLMVSIEKSVVDDLVPWSCDYISATALICLALYNYTVLQYCIRAADINAR